MYQIAEIMMEMFMHLEGRYINSVQDRR